nr:MAG TPA: hypothetical protein [Bacteriophage sp.]
MYIPADCAIIKHYQGTAENPETSPKKSIFLICLLYQKKNAKCKGCTDFSGAALDVIC